jgi:wyosine [tRNA(Phe)-imidazoG37] synthetase (radical SAM superfamily)
MPDHNPMIAFGPVPSRRLGQSLGVNNIPPKICSYSCIYCQIGRTLCYRRTREQYYEPGIVFEEMKKTVQKLEHQGTCIDYLSFVPDGEATLDINLGREISLLHKLGIRVAVISNASLMDRDDVREELHQADLVSLKVDTVNEATWRSMNKPDGKLDFSSILVGMEAFSKSYGGTLITETMLVKGINDELNEISKVAGFVSSLKPHKSYLSIPTRPPALKWVEPADEHVLTSAYFLFNSMAIETEYLIGYEGNEFAFTGNFERDILSITSVHPMRRDAVLSYLRKAHIEWQSVEKLLREDKLIEVPYKQQLYYMRKLS